MVKIKNAVIGTATILYLILLIIFAKDVGAAVINSLKVCIETIIPSLYVFMIISGFIVSSSLYKVLGKPFSLLSRYIFKIPEQYFSIFIIGSVGGYPIGAKLLADMRRENKIDSKTAERMLSYCYLAGPAFICGVAGIKVFSSTKAGMIIFSSILCANIITAIITGINCNVPPKEKYTLKLDISFTNLIMSVYNGAKGIFSICTIIVFFSSAVCIAEKLGFISFAAKIISDFSDLDYANSIAAVKAIIEISNITLLEPNNPMLLPLASALLSFGGICVLLQVEGFTSDILSTKRFYLFRFSSMLLSYFLCKILNIFFNINCVNTIAPSGVGYRQNSPIPTLFLLIMTILLLSNISMAKKKKM